MRNRAKCLLCNHVIESFHSLDLVTCECGEIFVEGGDAMRCGAGSWDNFRRVDDNGHEIVVKIENPVRTVLRKELDASANAGKVLEEAKLGTIHRPPDHIADEDKMVTEAPNALEVIDEMIKCYENLPPTAMQMAATNYDIVSLLHLIRKIAK